MSEFLLSRVKRHSRKRIHCAENGMTMIELLIAMAVLMIGLLGCTAMIVGAIQSNARNKNDTTAVVLDQEILETFATDINYPSTGTATIYDCATSSGGANAHLASLVSGGTPAGAGASLTASDTIDWTHAAPTYATSTVSGYAMKYQACNGDIFEVRWNVMNLTSTNASRLTLLTVSSRQTTSGSTGNAMLFSTPTTLSTMITD
jgi:prepilin-type N-terminal cleavage/methylation domain-containing protein